MRNVLIRKQGTFILCNIFAVTYEIIRFHRLCAFCRFPWRRYALDQKDRSQPESEEEIDSNQPESAYDMDTDADSDY